MSEPRNPISSEGNARELSAALPIDLGEFELPLDYTFEPEVCSPPPRSIPNELRQGRYGAKQRIALWLSAAAGIICFGCGQLPIVQLWGLFFLPLAYLDWIGVFLLGLAAFHGARRHVATGPYRYVRDGVPLVARIRELLLQPTLIVNGNTTAYCFTALIEYRHPETGAITISSSTSNNFSTDEKDKLNTSFQVGDYVTAIYQPSDFDKTLRLYGFLDLKPGLGIVPRDGAKPMRPFMAIFLLVAIFALFGVLVGNLYFFQRYCPLAMAFADEWIPFTVGAVLLGGGMLLGLRLNKTSQWRKMEQRNEQAVARGEAIELAADKQGWFGEHGWFMAVVLVAGSFLMGGLTLLSWSYAVNAWLDKSQPNVTPVQIVDMVEVTHGGIFRQYEIEYRFVDGNIDPNDTHSFLSSPDHLTQFEHDLATADVHAGWLGRRWVKNVSPVDIVELPDQQRGNQ